MEKIKIEASLQKVGNYNDLFYQGKPLPNKLVFLFSKETGMFYSTYMLQNKYKCHTKDLHNAIHSFEIYELTDFRDDHFNIIIELQTASYYELFHSPGALMINRTYFVRNNDYVKGPYVTDYKHILNKVDNFIEAITKGILLVPCIKQNFIGNPKKLTQVS